MIDSCGGLVATSKSTAFFCIYNFGIWIFFFVRGGLFTGRYLRGWSTKR